MLEKLPPFSINAEEAINGSLLVDNDCINQVKYLKSDDFFSEQNRLIFDACINLYKRNQLIDQITVAEELEHNGKLSLAGGVAYLYHLISITPHSLDAPGYAVIVHRDSIARQLINAASRIGSIGYEADTDIEGAIKKAEEIIDNVRQGLNVNKTEIVTPSQMADAMLNMLEHGQESIQWGFVDLDSLTTGIYPQDYIIFGARPSVGKTQIMLEVAENMARGGKRCLFVSTEMPMNPVVERYISRVFKISVRELRERRLKNQQFSEDDEMRYMEAVGVLSKLPVSYLFGKRSSDNIWDNARKMQESHGLDAIFVDYLQLLTDCNKGRENHSVAVGVVSHNLKAMGQSLNVPVIVASQLNRSLEHRDDKRPVLSDLRESGDIEQDADVVFLLHRPELFPDEYGKVAKEDVGVLELLMAKNRQLGTDERVVRLQWRPNDYRYGDRAKYV